LPNKVLAGVVGPAGEKPSALLRDLLAGKAAVGGEPTLYVCEGFTCQAPAVGRAAISAALDGLK